MKPIKKIVRCGNCKTPHAVLTTSWKGFFTCENVGKVCPDTVHFFRDGIVVYPETKER